MKLSRDKIRYFNMLGLRRHCEHTVAAVRDDTEYAALLEQHFARVFDELDALNHADFRKEVRRRVVAQKTCGVLDTVEKHGDYIIAQCLMDLEMRKKLMKRTTKINRTVALNIGQMLRPNLTNGEIIQTIDAAAAEKRIKDLRPPDRWPGWPEDFEQRYFRSEIEGLFESKEGSENHL